MVGVVPSFVLGVVDRYTGFVCRTSEKYRRLQNVCNSEVDPVV